jgi:hypothetical protein
MCLPEIIVRVFSTPKNIKIMRKKNITSGTFHCAICNSTQINLQSTAIPMRGSYGKNQTVYDKYAFCFNCNRNVLWIFIPKPENS